MSSHTLGLSMIVKNESHVILRVLNSVASIIDYWVVVDTGSTDGTQDLIKNFFAEKGIPGELIETEWVDFSHARNISLNAVESKVDYGMWIDADEEMVLSPGFNKEKMLSGESDSYSITTVYGRVDYTRKNIWKTKMGFSWNGPIHELLSSPNERTGAIADNVKVIVRAEGHSWQNIKEKYAAHAEILAEYTKVNSDPRWIFYTAQSYRDCQNYEKSIEWYRKRAQVLDGFLEEIYISRLMIAQLSEIIGKSKSECTILYQEAHATDPVRGEAIKGLIKMYQRLQDWENAYIYSLYGIRYSGNNPYPNRILFIDKTLYEFEMLELHSLSCFYTKRIDEASRAYWTMRAQIDSYGPNFYPQELMDKIESNSKFYPKLPTTAMPQLTTSGVKRNSNYTPPKKKRKK